MVTPIKSSSASSVAVASRRHISGAVPANVRTALEVIAAFDAMPVVIQGEIPAYVREAMDVVAAFDSKTAQAIAAFAALPAVTGTVPFVASALPAVMGALPNAAGSLPARTTEIASVTAIADTTAHITEVEIVGKGMVVNSPGSPERVIDIFKDLNLLIPKGVTDIWFNSLQEMNNWAATGGQTEGIGVWRGTWLNLANKGPIVYGEVEHNEDKRDFIRALHIEHYLLEANSERSLSGVTGIPTTKESSIYVGDEAGTGHALENFWVKNGTAMDTWWGDGTVRGISEARPSKVAITSIKELVGVISAIPTQTTGTQLASLVNKAKEALEGAQKCGLDGFIKALDKCAQKSSNNWVVPSSAYEKEFFDERATLFYGESGDIDNTTDFNRHFSGFKEAIEQIGRLHFLANVSEEEGFADEVNSKANVGNPMKIWAGRREVFMLRNLIVALKKKSQPLLITMGHVHAENQEKQIKCHIKPENLIIGVTNLVAFGTRKPTPEPSTSVAAASASAP